MNFRSTLLLLGLVFILSYSPVVAQNEMGNLFSFNYSFEPEDQYSLSRSTNKILVWNNDTDFLNRTDDIVKIDIKLINSSVPVSMGVELRNYHIYEVSGKIYRSYSVETPFIVSGSILTIFVDWYELLKFNNYTYACTDCEKSVVSQIYLTLSSQSMWTHTALVSIEASYMNSSSYIDDSTDAYVINSGLILSETDSTQYINSKDEILSSTTDEGVSPSIYYPILLLVILRRKYL